MDLIYLRLTYLYKKYSLFNDIHSLQNWFPGCWYLLNSKLISRLLISCSSSRRLSLSSSSSCWVIVLSFKEFAPLLSGFSAQTFETFCDIVKCLIKISGISCKVFLVGRSFSCYSWNVVEWWTRICPLKIGWVLIHPDTASLQLIDISFDHGPS